ncbi:hypothetical protein [Bacillus badius]|uniref:Uncharacterized protein n=1 Tax=Bacillus badius TaxID=1455 RepID=A0ABR5ASR0_BACBA|nr:hypothetical protein [Bacillus badius]KIL77798.1 hypothetical protein SD77_1127 [Bacillus badius]KZR59222.1 hypothetical protein A3781_13755 [Bacillus badius]MED4715694.1 hypothetical protein [Bacillus badius]
MGLLIESHIKSLSENGLMLLVEDAERRIGSHVACGDPVEEYVDHQKYIFSLVQPELERRK